MSSRSIIRVRPKHQIQVQEDQTVSLARLFGSGMCRRVQDVLDHIDTEKKRLQLSGNERMNWSKFSEQSNGRPGYQLTLQGDALGNELAGHGVASVPIQLYLNEGTLQVRYSCNFDTLAENAEAVRQAVAPAVQKAVNASVNTLLAWTLNKMVSEQFVANYVPAHLKNEVRNRVTNQYAFQTSAQYERR